MLRFMSFELVGRFFDISQIKKLYHDYSLPFVMITIEKGHLTTSRVTFVSSISLHGKYAFKENPTHAEPCHSENISYVPKA